ncbi:unnamed protein product [Victoria cruziana]
MEEGKEEGSEERFVTTSSEGREEGSEESGWTSYFEYFMQQERGLESSPSSAYEGPPSTVSDAASAAEHNLLCRVRVSAPPKACKRLEFRRRTTKSVVDEDPLEDTASSPLSSPKVSGMSLDMGSCRKEENCSAVMAENSSRNRSPLQTQRRNGMLQIPAQDEYAELKKRGLCLVPLSMLVDYTG